MKKREWVYCDHPFAYEIAGCPNDPTLDLDMLPRHNENSSFRSHKVTWSEYEGHLWCYDCETDFIPCHWGVFSGPIPIGACEILGISLDKIDLKTGRRMIFNKEEGKYV